MPMTPELKVCNVREHLVSPDHQPQSMSKLPKGIEANSDLPSAVELISVSVEV